MTAPLDFVFKPFEKMTPEDYALIGLRSGLEIHQQLKTRRKLFCRCPAGKYSTRVDAEILRHMRPTLSELGEYDGTALMEFKTKKEIVYLLNSETVCTYEMDDAPPFEMDPKAIEIAIEIALLLKLNLVSELHIARKQYLDGSIPTGFQRTTILGIDGKIEVNGKPIRIIQLGLEEDSCREVSDVGHRIVFRTDRLGMPLIETVTYPDMVTPEEVAVTADTLRRLVRSTGKVRTGAGAAREDVNVSIDGGTRIEIKGVPSIRRIPHLIYNEAMRQHNLLKIRAELAHRGITTETFNTQKADVTAIVRGTSYVPIARALERGGVVSAVRLTGFAGILAHPTQEHTFFAEEISDRVKVIACLMEHPNILHSDSTDSGISRGHWTRIRKRLRGKAGDTIVLVWGSEGDVETAIQEITIRAREATIGVPSETRQAYHDGTNGFERILPGADRMYPDTDEPPIAIDDKIIERLQKELPEIHWECAKRLKDSGVPDWAANLLSVSPLMPLFDAVLAQTGTDAKRLALLFVRDLRHLHNAGLPVARLDEKALIELVRAVDEKRVLPEALPLMTFALANGVAGSAAEAVALYTPRGNEKATLDKLVAEAMEKQHSLLSAKKRARLDFLMGHCLHALRGRIAADRVRALLMEGIVGHDEP